jgi:hypothetical protein
MTGKMTTEVFIASAFTGYFVKAYHRHRLDSFNLFGTFYNRKIPAMNNIIDENQDVAGVC